MARRTVAQAIADGDVALVDRLASGLLKPLADNFVERPWGGMRIREYKRLCPLPDQPAIGGSGLGEAFEIAAFDADDEAREHPSRLRFDDGSEVTLPELLGRHGDALLGTAFTSRYGKRFPLLPKTLDIAELLSVQGHPEGNTEVYIVIAADPGATIRVGFNADVDGAGLAAELSRGRERQRRLLGLAGPRCDAARLQALVKPWFAARGVGLDALPAELRELFAGARWHEAAALLEQLKGVYWRTLDSMNALPVSAGRIVYNANPERILAGTGKAPSAEVHALGNPEGREILLLEIRKPGPTFRAWDNVRFPLRQVDVEAAVAALNLRRTEPAELLVREEPVPGRPGVFRSVRCAEFSIEHIRPSPGGEVSVPAEPPHSLHALAGRVVVHAESGRLLGTLDRGESALVPARVGTYHVSCGESGAEVVKVSLPSGR